MGTTLPSGRAAGGADGEVVLAGGNVSGGIVRVGDTVRRPAGPWSAGVDALLVHLERVGFDGAPRALGYDERGRQVVTFVEGRAEADPSDLSLDGVRQVGHLVREFHDAASSFVAPPGTAWNVAIRPDRQDLICHHDLAPWNLVRGVRRPVFVDWDGAGPGSRLWDLAYAAHGFVALSPRNALRDADAAARLAALVDGYGLDEVQRAELLELLAPRILSMYNLLRRGHETGTEPWSRLWAEGHGEIWFADGRYTEARAGHWTRALLG